MTVSDSLKEIFIKLPELLDNLGACAEFVRARTKSERVLCALDRLVKVDEILEIYGFSAYITIDLSMLSQYSYYTGIIFRAYTYGSGEALATGGRYDGLVGQFGKDAEAIGLAIVVDQLMLALTRQNLFEEYTLGGTILLYPQNLRQKAVQLAEEYRRQGQSVQMLRKSSRKPYEQYKEYAKRMQADTILYLEKEEELLVFDTASGKEEHKAL